MNEESSISLFLKALDEELYHEIVIQRDPTEFWFKASSALFETSIAGFKEQVIALHELCKEDVDLYDYATTMIMRLTSNPHHDAAIKSFIEGSDPKVNRLDNLLSDPFFGGGVAYQPSTMSRVEKLLLFITVHRTRIQLAIVQQRNAIAEESRTKRHNQGNKGVK